MNENLDATIETAQRARVDRLTKKVARGGAIVFVGQIAERVLATLLQVLLGNYLGARAYGLYSLGLGVIRIGQQISLMGLSNGAVRFVALHQSAGETAQIKGVILGALSLAFLFSIACTAALWIASPWISVRFFHQPELAPYLRWLAFSIPLMVLFQVARASLRGYQRIGQMVALPLARSLFQLILVAGAFLLGLHLGGAVAAFVLSAFLALILGVFWILRVQPDLMRNPVFQIRRLLRFSIPVFFSGVSYLLMSRVDLLMIGYFLEPSYAGFYRASVAVASLVNFMLGVFNAGFAPMMSQLFHKGALQELGKLYKTVTRWIFLTAMIGCLIAVLFSHQILRLFGPEFPKGAWALSVLAVAQLLNASVGSVGLLLQMSGRQDWLLLNNIITALLNLGLNLLFIPRWGILGAAMATGTSIALRNLLGLVEVWRFFRMHPWSRRSWMAVAGGGVALIVGLGSMHLGLFWPVSAAAMAGAYFGIMLWIGLESEDRLIFDTIRKRLRGGAE